MRKSLTEKFLWVSIAAACLMSMGHVATPAPGHVAEVAPDLTPSPCPTPSKGAEAVATGDGGAMLPLGWVSAVAWHD